MNEWEGIGAVIAALGLLIGAVAVLRARKWIGSEGARKGVHIGMGVVCLSFPWIFRDPLPVWILAGLACAALALLRIVPTLRGSVGQVLHGVDRVSLGELYFPLAVATVFTLAGRDRGLFLVPVALLTFADAAGALVGKRWGRHSYETLEGTKSLEGSSAVGAASFLCVVIGFGIHTQNVPLLILEGLVVGIFAALVEAISWRGLDNLFLPIAAFAQLKHYEGLDLIDMEFRLQVLASLGVVAVIWRRGQVMNDGARLGAVLLLFLLWSVGGVEWLAAPILFIASYVRLMPVPKGGNPRHNLVAVLCIGSIAVVTLTSYAFTENPLALWWFTAGLAAHQAIVGTVRYSQGFSWGRWQCWSVAVATALVVQGVGALLVGARQELSLNGWLFGAVGVIVGSAVFVMVEPKLQQPDDLNVRWWKQGLAAALSSAICFFQSHL